MATTGETAAQSRKGAHPVDIGGALLQLVRLRQSWLPDTGARSPESVGRVPILRAMNLQRRTSGFQTTWIAKSEFRMCSTSRRTAGSDGILL